MRKLTNNKKIHLHQVALIAISSSDIKPSIEALVKSSEEINFNEKIFITSRESLDESDINQCSSNGIEIKYIDQIKSVNEYSFFILRSLQNFFNSDFCLIIQWDGWVINPNSWLSEFLNYDYIGAIWPKEIWPEKEGYRVGNGGFSLRSKKLCIATSEIIQNHTIEETNIIEDEFIGKNYRDLLESKYKIQISTEILANKFSIERAKWDSRSFGFHGFFNFNKIFNDKDLFDKLETLNIGCFSTRLSYDLAINLIKEKRFYISRKVIDKRFQCSGFTRKNLRLKIFWIIFKLIYKDNSQI